MLRMNAAPLNLYPTVYFNFFANNRNARRKCRSLGYPVWPLIFNAQQNHAVFYLPEIFYIQSLRMPWGQSPENKSDGLESTCIFPAIK